MLRKYLRKFHYKYRFVPWYRKAYYYKCKKDKMDEIIAKYKEPEELADPKYVKKLKRDMIRCLFKYGSYYSEYFTFGYEGQDAEYRNSFITEGIRLSYYPRMNQRKNTDLLENKYRTYKKFKDMYKREVIRILKNEKPTEENLAKLREFAERHENYVVKPVYAAFGNGVRVENLGMYDSVEEAHQEYSKSGAVIEEVIVQGEALSKIHAGSVNSNRHY